MIIMIGGSRGWDDTEIIAQIVSGLKEQDVVIHGNCPNSPDIIVGKMSKSRGLVVGEFPYVSQKGKVGGHIRNRVMVDIADGCIFFWNGKSQGTAKTINYARDKGKLLQVIVEGQNNQAIDDIMKALFNEENDK